MYQIYGGIILVFSKYFLAGFEEFSMFIYRVKGGTDSCKCVVILKLKTYVKFISGVVVYSMCHC